MPKRKRDLKSGLMSIALFATGVVEAIEHSEDGEPILSAIGGAVERTRIRGRAMKRASRAAAKQIRDLDKP